MAVLVVTAAVVVVAAILVVVKAVVVVAREVLVDEEEVEARFRAGRPAVGRGGGASACGASAGEHATVKTAATAKAKAKCFTVNSFPEGTRSVLR